MLEKLNKEQLKKIAKQYDLFDIENMNEKQLRNAIYAVSGETDKIKNDKIKFKKFFVFDWVTIFLITFLMIDLLTLITPYVIYFQFNNVIKIRHLYISTIIDVLSLILCIFFFKHYFQNCYINWWVIAWWVLDICYWIYFLLDMHSIVASDEITLGKLLNIKIVNQFVDAFWIVVWVSVSITSISLISLSLSIIKK